jgi:hypothetical protein
VQQLLSAYLPTSSFVAWARCTMQCEFKHVMGNLYLCATSGQAHVCDQNCSQRIFYDNHTDICRLSRRVFPRAEAPMADMARCLTLPPAAASCVSLSASH